MKTILKLSPDLLATKRTTLKKDIAPAVQGVSQLTLEDKRFAVLERSVYMEGVKVIQKQERIGNVLTLIGALVLFVLLFIVIRTVS